MKENDKSLYYNTTQSVKQQLNENAYRKHRRISSTFLLKIFVSNPGYGLSATTSVHHAVNLRKLTFLSENFTVCV